MSSSFLKAAGLVATVAMSTAQAADVYFTPLLDAGIEHHTNVDLNPFDNAVFKEDVTGYVANVGGIFGVRSPRGLTELTPRLQLQHYPDRDDLQTVNGYLDLNSQYSSLLNKWELQGFYRRENSKQAQLVNAGSGFENFNPTDAGIGGAGRVNVQKETVTDYQLRPSFRHNLTERFGFGVNGSFQQVSFDADGAPSGVDYQALVGGAFVFWQLRQRTFLSSGAYTSHFETDTGSNTTKSNGLSVDLTHSWTQRLTGLATVNLERTEVEQVGQLAADKSTNLGFVVGLVGQGEITQWRVTAGRSLSPTNYGSRASVDQIRAQYSYNLSPRWKATSALRAFRARAQGDSVNRSENRDYARGEVELRWNASRTWFVTGGYAYTTQEYRGDSAAGNDNFFTVKVGYEGLPPPR